MTDFFGLYLLFGCVELDVQREKASNVTQAFWNEMNKQKGMRDASLRYFCLVKSEIKL